jgi:hypothetical protein
MLARTDSNNSLADDDSQGCTSKSVEGSSKRRPSKLDEKLKKQKEQWIAEFVHSEFATGHGELDVQPLDEKEAEALAALKMNDETESTKKNKPRRVSNYEIALESKADPSLEIYGGKDEEIVISATLVSGTSSKTSNGHVVENETNRAGEKRLSTRRTPSQYELLLLEKQSESTNAPPMKRNSSKNGSDMDQPSVAPAVSKPVLNAYELKLTEVSSEYQKQTQGSESEKSASGKRASVGRRPSQYELMLQQKKDEEEKRKLEPKPAPVKITEA